MIVQLYTAEDLEYKNMIKEMIKMVDRWNETSKYELLLDIHHLNHFKEMNKGKFKGAGYSNIELLVSLARQIYNIRFENKTKPPKAKVA